MTKPRHFRGLRVRGLFGIAGIVAVSVVISSCTEVPTAPATSAPESQEFDRSMILTALTCDADVVSRKVTCGQMGRDNSQGDAGDPARPNIILGGQGVFVTVQTSNVIYDGGTGAFTFDATVRNLIPQPIGTADTIPPLADPHAAGVRIFIASGPTVTGGTGSISVASDGTAAFTAPDQHYFQYNTVLDQFEISAPKNWAMNMPSTVTNFAFVLLVSAAVPRPDGYIDLQISNNAVRPPDDKQMTYVVRNANGTIAASQGPLTWGTSDPTLATVNSEGVVDPLRAGQVTIYAQTVDGLRVGSRLITVRPIRRTWTGAVSTDWHTGGNWAPDAIVPGATDTAVIASGVANMPVLSANASIGGVELTGAPITLSLGAFNLTASGSVSMVGGGNISGSAGRLVLIGIAQTVSGITPRITVTGTYSLNANLTVTGQVRAQGGRLRNQAFRVRVTG